MSRKNFKFLTTALFMLRFGGTKAQNAVIFKGDNVCGACDRASHSNDKKQ